MILTNKKYKIALIGFRLAKGGAEKALANLSVFFDKKGIVVHNIIVLDDVSYNYAGKLLNLGKLKNDSNNVLNKIKRLVFLKKYLKENQFDYIIDFRPRTKYFQEFLIAKWLYKTKTIFSVRSYLIDYYMPNWTFLTQLIYGKCFKIVVVTNLTKELIQKKHQLKNVVTIYNPIVFEDIIARGIQEIDLDFDYIIAVGEMETNIKQFDKLIEAYSNSILPINSIHLVLLGDGKRKSIFQDFAKQKKVQDKVHFLGYQDNPVKFVKNAKFLVLSSLNEGMPNVILESLACETPVIAFDCPSGPSEIIIDKKNGLLVENQNVEKLTEAMNLFINDEELYKNCKKNALESVQQFSLENIGKQWLDLMNISIN
jgi:N-acetylgalactosamine-N,N'-diacetylbacillosaminyl-diphospho-undecaprenol 4-alpha-N-acetylgalactosaminyltransferase